MGVSDHLPVLAAHEARWLERARRWGEEALAAAEPPPRPAMRLSAPHGWRRLTEAELRFVWPALEALCLHEVGRPAGLDLLTRFEAVLEAAMVRRPWREVVTTTAPAAKGDTLGRTFRRWAERGLWLRLLLRLHRKRPDLPALTYFICRAARRAWRVQGEAGVRAAFETGFASALRGPPRCFPDRDLSAHWRRALIRPVLPLLFGLPRGAADAVLRVARWVRWHYGGRRRIRRCWEPA